LRIDIKINSPVYDRKIIVRQNGFGTNLGFLCLKVSQKLIRHNKNKMNNNSIKIETGTLEVHPLTAAVTCKTKNSMAHNFTMANFGQVEPISIVMRDGKPFIIDGVERWKIAKLKPALFPEMDCRILELKDEEIVNRRILLNSTRKQSIREKCKLVESILDILGKQPGIKREILGIDGMNLKDKYSPKINLDRFHFACHIAQSDCSATTLRKLMAIYNFEGEQKEKILDLIDEGRVTIDKGFKVLISKKRKEKESEQLRINHFGNGELGSFQLYCQSSLSMSQMPDNSARLCVNSHPYFTIRDYRNQGDSIHGQESTVDEYIDNFILHSREVKKKLKPNGVLVTIIGETYRHGYQGICTKVETALQNDGWRIIDVNIWTKKNPKFAPHPSRFMNGYERIIVACKSNEEPVFNVIKKPSATGEFKVIRSSELVNGNCNYSMASPDADITNVISTSVFNKKEHSVIDKEFSHDAPAPEEIYEMFIKAYSMPDDTIIDNFVGTGTVGVALKLGRNVIGYDVDPVSIEFARKRFERILGESVETISMAA
jgi:DNA modification methylase